MKKVAIVGVEGSGKTVMLAGLGDLYTYPDEEGYFLAPKNFGTAAYVAEKIARMRKGEWPVATAGDEMQGLDWTLKRQKPGENGRPEVICEVSFLDFAGEVYRAAYGISGGGEASQKEQVEELRRYVRGADGLIVLINLRDVITNGLRDTRVQEAMWITKSILDTAFGDGSGKDMPRAAIVLSQADSYAETIKACGGAPGVLRNYLPHVANDYNWLDVFAVNAVDKTSLDDDGHEVPAADFTAKGLLPILKWIRKGSAADDDGRQDPMPCPRQDPRFPVGAKAGERRTFKIHDNVAMEFAWCPATTDNEWKKISNGADTFAMGSPVGEKGRKADEFLHPVRLSRGFWIATTPVMQIQWEGIMGAKENRSPLMKSAEKPVTRVSYDDAMAFIEKIHGFGCPVALPTEAQWEYACRAGKRGSFGAGRIGLLVLPAERPGYFAMGSSVLLHFCIVYIGWIVGVIKLVFLGGRPAPLKQFAANAWGLYDMHGNCGEWCVDWYGPYPPTEVTDPQGPESGPGHVVRGMRGYRVEGNCRSAARWCVATQFLFRRIRHPLVGLRLVINP